MSAASISSKRIRITVSGIVQGVGFRPFIYNLANELSLRGFVYNTEAGVVIEAEAETKELDRFLELIKTQTPPLAKITSIEYDEIPLVVGEEAFEIHASLKSEKAIHTMLSADISLCDACREEMRDKNNRRYNYPFINCTDCGPRYSIIKKLPYDRVNTSMAGFSMCSACKEEYENPKSRRYHAQPISCFECGPKLEYIDMFAKDHGFDMDAISLAVKKIEEGGIIALKGLGGFHIVCDATNEEAVATLRKNKHRPTKPLAVMFCSLYAIKKVATVTKQDEALIRSKERPIVIVNKRDSFALAKSIAPNIDKIGVFLPYTPLHELLLAKLKVPIVATSANLSDEPIITDEKDIKEKLPLVVDAILTHDREIVNACDDSVRMTLGSKDLFLRQARGYAPVNFHLKKAVTKNILAVGANQKNTLCFAFGNNIINSPHIGDLNSIEAFEYFKTVLDTFKRIYNFEPEVIVCDKHPRYETTLWAKEYVMQHKEVKLLEVQHHYAHALSVMAEYALDEEVLAFCFDGTGYGDDGSLWGGEVLIATRKEYKRVYSFKSLHLLGGDKAVREPKRVGLSLLFECFTLEEILTMDIPLVKSYSPNELKTLHRMFARKINAPVSSSVGRLFDGVYALSGHLAPLGYEGESGLIMEGLAKEIGTKKSYSYTIEGSEISYKKMVCEIIQEDSKKIISAKFLNTLCNIILEIASKHPHLPLLFSGGVFQNKILLQKVTKALDSMGRRYYIQQMSPINDGSIALGQVYYAVKNLKDEDE